MKSAKVFAALLLFISFLFTNCSPDRDYLFTTDEIITRGNWDVEFFVDDNKTAAFNNYSFQFNANGKVYGTDGTKSVEGNWNVIRDVDRSDLLTINMNEQDNVNELSNAWSVKAKSNEAFTFQAKGNTTEFLLRKL